MDCGITAPDAPWQNGCVEALIKSCKKALFHAIGLQVLTFSELQTVMFEVANLMNERPIGRHPSDPSEGSYQIICFWVELHIRCLAVHLKNRPVLNIDMRLSSKLLIPIGRKWSSNIFLR